MTDAAEATETVVNDRGELMLVIDGQPYGLRPSYDAIETIETMLGRGLVDVAGDAINSRLKLGELAQVATECIKAWGRANGRPDTANFNAKRVARLIIDADGGLLTAMRKVGQLLTLAVTGGYDSEGNPKPAVTTTSEEAPAAG